MKVTQPALLRAVTRADSVVAPKLEKVVHSEVFGLGIAVAVRFRRELSVRTERLSRHALHTLNLPAGSDVRRLLVQVAMVERAVRELGKTLEESRPVRIGDHVQD